MEAKKNPSKDLSLQRNKFFLIGLTVSISLAITAFEWRTVKEKPIVRDFDPVETEALLIVPPTTIDLPSASQPVQKMEQKKLMQVDPTPATITTGETVDDNQPELKFEPDPGLSIGTVTLYPEPEGDTDIFFIFVENNPRPINGFKSFYDQLGKNIKYPTQAKRNGTEGKVFVEFIINKNGEPSDLKITKGIGSGCDEEAMRVLSLTKWEPGKQRGKPVRVKMVLSISFQLSQ